MNTITLTIVIVFSCLFIYVWIFGFHASFLWHPFVPSLGLLIGVSLNRGICFITISPLLFTAELDINLPWQE